MFGDVEEVFLHTPIKVTDFFRLVGRMRARKLEAEAKK